jgi:hypothetical protein
MFFTGKFRILICLTTLLIQSCGDSTVNVKKEQLNLPPTVNINSPEKAYSGEVVTLTAEIFEPEGQAVTIEWSVNKGDRIILSSINSAQISFSVPLMELDNQIELMVKVSDDQGLVTTEKTIIDIPAIITKFTIPYKPISLRYVFIEAGFENLNLDNVKLQWVITNNQRLDLENDDTKKVQFYAKNQLAEHEDFETHQEVELALTLSHQDQQLIFPTSVTIGPVDTAPQWPIRNIPQANLLKSTFKTTNILQTKNINNKQVNESHLDLNGDGLIDFLRIEEGEVSYYQAIDIDTYQEKVKIITSVYIDFSLGQEADIDNNGLLELYVFERNDANFSSNTFARFYYEPLQEAVVYQKITDVDVSYTPTDNIDVWQPYAASYQLLQQESQLYLLTTHVNKNALTGSCLNGCPVWYTSQLDVFNIDGFSITGKSNLWYYIPEKEHNYYQEIIPSDINEDGITDILIKGMIGEYFEIDYYFFQDIAVFDGSGNFPVTVLKGQGKIYQKNIDEDNYLEWIYSGYKTNYPSVFCSIRYHLSLESGVINRIKRGECPSDIGLFNNLSTQTNATKSTLNNSTGYVHLYDFNGVHNYCQGMWIDGCSNYHTFSNNSFFTFELTDTSVPVFLTREPYVNGGIKRLSTYQKNEFELIDMDNDGDLDIKGDNSWLENIESIPIIIPNNATIDE